MQLLYGVTSEMVVIITENFFGGLYRLYFAEHVNASPPNPPSSNPIKIFLDYTEIIRTNDVKNPKLVMHRRGIKRAIRQRITDPETQKEANRTIASLNIHGIKPYLAILEVDTYLQKHYSREITLRNLRIDPSVGGSPLSMEYLLDDLIGPNRPDAELHIEKLFP